jgi:hypothetical protein
MFNKIHYDFFPRKVILNFIFKSHLIYLFLELLNCQINPSSSASLSHFAGKNFQYIPIWSFLKLNPKFVFEIEKLLEESYQKCLDLNSTEQNKNNLNFGNGPVKDLKYKNYIYMTRKTHKSNH